MGRRRKDEGPYLCSVPLPWEWAAETLDPVSQRPQSPLRMARFPTVWMPRGLMIHICQSLCLACDWSWGGGQLSGGPPGHVRFHMAQMWHVVRGMAADDGCDSRY